jgi:hypothetical protein
MCFPELIYFGYDHGNGYNSGLVAYFLHNAGIKSQHYVKLVQPIALAMRFL